MSTIVRRSCSALLAAALPLAGLVALPPSPAQASSPTGSSSLRHAHGRLLLRGPGQGARHTVQVRGRLSVVPGEDGGADRYLLRTGSRSLKVALPQVRADEVRTGDQFSGTVLATTSGQAQTDRTGSLTVAEATVAPASAQADTASGSRRLVLAAMDGRGANLSDATFLTSAQKVADYWKAQSEGRLGGYTRTSTVKHYTTSFTSPSNACGLNSDDPQFDQLVTEAQKQFTGLTDTDTIVVLIPDSCRTSSVDGISTGGLVFVAGNSSLDQAMAHEEGHELGLDHAWLGSCSSACDGIEYGDASSVMGGGNGSLHQLTALNSAFRHSLGWTSPADETLVSLPGSQSSLTRDVTLLPRSSSGGMRSVQVLDPDNAGTFFIELRRLEGADAGSALETSPCCQGFSAGVSMVYQPGGTRRSVLHLLGPDDTSGLDVGDPVWTSPSGGLQLQVLSDNGAAGDVVRLTLSSAHPGFTTAPVPRLVGSAAPDSQVSADLGTWNPTYDSVSYQWNLDGAPINEWWARAENYFPTNDDVGKALTVTVTVSKSGYRTTRLTSAPLTVGWLQPRVPTIYGASKPWVGRNLTAQEGDWGPDATFTYAWYAGATRVGTARDLVLTTAMKGQPITVTVTGHSHGQSVSRTSAATAPVQLPPLSASTPTVSGSPLVSGTLRASTGTWTSGTAFAYRWLADDTPIGGATGSTYSPTSEEQGKAIRAEVTGTRSGYAPTVRTSAPTAAVSYAPWAPTVPAVAGTPRYPNALSTATFWGSEGSYAYQWLDNGIAIAGATAARYAPTPGKVGHKLSVRVVGTAPDATTTTLTSAPVTLQRGVLTAPTPTVTGSPRVGTRLTAVPHTWTSGTTLRYQWYRGSVAISRATARTYTVPRTMKGRRLRVRVTGAKTGYTTVSRYSALTGVVR